MALSESGIQKRIAEVNRFSDAEAAWLAAAIDAESHIREYVSYIGKDDQPVTTARIKINMVSREFVERFREIVGVGKIRACRPARAGWSSQWVLEINGWAVVPILEQILPWLIIKRERAIEIIAVMEAKRGDF